MISYIWKHIKYLFTKTVEKNVKLEVVLHDYQEKTRKELFIANDKLDKLTADLLHAEERLAQEQKAYNGIIEAMKKATPEDRDYLHDVARQKLRVIPAYERAVENLTQAQENLRTSIRLATLEVEENIAHLQTAVATNAGYDLSTGVGLSSLGDVLAVVNDKKRLIQAKEINDKALQRVEPKFQEDCSDIDAQIAKDLGA